MKKIRVIVIGLVGLVTFAACAFLGTMIGFSMEPDLAALATAIVGFYVGSGIGFFVAIVVAKYFAGYIWPLERKQKWATAGEYQQHLMAELESNDPETEKQRVEKYGHKIVICSSCGTKNSLSFSRCLKCSKDLSSEQPVDNPYL